MSKQYHIRWRKCQKYFYVTHWQNKYPWHFLTSLSLYIFTIWKECHFHEQFNYRYSLPSQFFPPSYCFPRYDDVLAWCWIFLYSFIYFWADDWLISININLLMHFTHALIDYSITSIVFLLFRLVCFIMAIPMSWNHVSSHVVPQSATGCRYVNSLSWASFVLFLFSLYKPLEVNDSGQRICSNTCRSLAYTYIYWCIAYILLYIQNCSNKIHLLCLSK